MPFDGFDRLLSLLRKECLPKIALIITNALPELASGILGTAALILPKAQILDVTRKLSGGHRGKSDDG